MLVRTIHRLLPGLLLALSFLWVSGGLASEVFIEDERNVVRAAEWVFVAEVTSYKPWFAAERCSRGIHIKVRSIELLKGRAREFVDLPYELSWPLPMSDDCWGESYVEPPAARDLKKGAIVIATVSPLNDRPEQVYATLDFWHYAAVKRWVRFKRRPLPPTKRRRPGR